MTRQIILDTETTGLLTTEKHRLIEIACIEMIDRRFTGRHYQTYINPQRPVDKGAFEIHGLNDDFLKDKPLFANVMTEFLEFISGAELIIHNAPFDIGFINYELKLLGKNFLIEERCSIIDTLILARNKHPGQSNSLDALCRRYQVDNSKRDLHGALIDTQLLGRVYLAMTGGQDQLFMDSDVNQKIQVAAENDFMQAAPILKSERSALSIIEPSIEELAAHHEFLELLKKNGRCLW